MQLEKEETQSNQLDYIKALGRLQGDIERIIKASSAMDKSTIINMLRMALAQSDIDCSKILKNLLNGGKRA